MTEEAISNLSNALALLNEHEYDKETIRNLVRNIVDAKHLDYIERGLDTNDKSLIMHGIIGALSHYEAEKAKTNALKKHN